MVYLVDGNTGFTQAIIDGLGGEAIEMFFTIEAFLFSGCDQLTIANKSHAGVVVITG